MRQRRWNQILSDYSGEIKYHPARQNVVQDALSQKKDSSPTNRDGRNSRHTYGKLFKKHLGTRQQSNRLTTLRPTVRKCLAEPDVQVPLDEIEVDENLRFVEEPLEIVERDVKKLKRRRIPLVKVRWNSRQGAEYTWEREDQFRKRYPNLFSETVPPSGVAT
ncbi:hypothetical protein Tco_0475421 [Tanacetum coccineum]